ncbi:hypothetical protein [Streptomyces echinatus]|uniref:hypothetical protein n=1 Tax=Streptomyces echinatus TaxID=67293 RepID=UPI0037AB158E
MSTDDRSFLAAGRVAARLPARDLDRARRFCAERLGLRPAEEAPGGLLYRCGGAEFQVFRSAGASARARGAWFRDNEGNMLGIGRPTELG